MVWYGVVALEERSYSWYRLQSDHLTLSQSHERNASDVASTSNNSRPAFPKTSTINQTDIFPHKECRTSAFAISSCQENRKWPMPFLSTSQQPLTQTIPLLETSAIVYEMLFTLQSSVSRMSPFSVFSDYMTLVLCMFLRNAAWTFAFSLWSLLRPTLLDFPCTFCLLCISLVFSHLKSPLSFVHTIASPLYSYLIPLNSNRLLLICSHFLWSPLCGPE